MTSFLECVGSDIVENENIEPVTSFNIDIDGKNFEIGVTSISNEDNDYKNIYWII